MNKQCIFMDNEGTVQAGIYNTNTDEIICGCCGATIKSGDFVILHLYEEWLNISDEICGDDGEVLHGIERKVDSMTTDEIQAVLDGKKDFNE